MEKALYRRPKFSTIILVSYRDGYVFWNIDSSFGRAPKKEQRNALVQIKCLGKTRLVTLKIGLFFIFVLQKLLILRISKLEEGLLTITHTNANIQAHHFRKMVIMLYSSFVSKIENKFETPKK